MGIEIRRIVAGIAEVHGDDPLLPAALDLAARTGAELHLVHAFQLHSPALDAYARLGFMDTRAPREYAAGLRERLAMQASRHGGAERVRCHAVTGPAGEVLQDVARQEEADLILVGATRRGSMARAVLGTTAQLTVRGAPCPVLVVREPISRHLRRVLLTTDLAPSTASVHEAGLDAVEALFPGDQPERRSLYVAWSGLPRMEGTGFEPPYEFPRAQLREFLDARRWRGRRVDGVVRFGDPASEIADEAARWHPDLLILGTHGRRGIPRVALGSVAEDALRGTGCNVLVVPPAAYGRAAWRGEATRTEEPSPVEIVPR